MGIDFTPLATMTLAAIGAFAGFIVAAVMAAFGFPVWWCLGTIAVCALVAPPIFYAAFD